MAGWSYKSRMRVIFAVKSGSRLVLQVLVRCQVTPASPDTRRTVSVDTLNR